MKVITKSGQNALPTTGGLPSVLLRGGATAAVARRKGSAKLKGSSPQKW